MPSFRCQHPTCAEYVRERGTFCPTCQEQGRTAPSRHQHYDQHQRDREAKQFYDSAAWQKVRAAVLTDQPWCGLCGKLATMVHHVQPIAEAWHRRLDRENLASLCASCHSHHHATETTARVRAHE